MTWRAISARHYTGAWDKTIRTWDVRNGMCLHVTAVHLADVYAIATHPGRGVVENKHSNDVESPPPLSSSSSPHLIPPPPSSSSVRLHEHSHSRLVTL